MAIRSLGHISHFQGQVGALGIDDYIPLVPVKRISDPQWNVPRFSADAVAKAKRLGLPLVPGLGGLGALGEPVVVVSSLSGLAGAGGRPSTEQLRMERRLAMQGRRLRK